jgi:hypothetical protein
VKRKKVVNILSRQAARSVKRRLEGLKENKNNARAEGNN